jgi:hypothetical protein
LGLETLPRETEFIEWIPNERETCSDENPIVNLPQAII